MSRLVSAAVALLLLASACAASAAEQRDYPIHFDGPMVHHGLPWGTVREQELPHFFVMFHGGPVQVTTKSYAIYWRPPGTHMSPRYAPLLDRFLTDVGGSRMYGVLTQYYGSNGQVRNESTFAGSWTDTSPYPDKITDESIQHEVQDAMDANHWHPGVGVSFYVMTAKDAVKNVGFCAYHSAFNLEHHAEHPVVYAFIPYVGFINGCDPPYGISPNNDIAADGSIISMSHEQNEMVSDPLLNAWYDPNNGEIGDICIFAYGVPFGPNGANIVINDHPYFLQGAWSQQARSCQPNL